MWLASVTCFGCLGFFVALAVLIVAPLGYAAWRDHKRLKDRGEE